MGEVKRTFNPEFINRIDEIIIFDALTDPDLVQITRLLVEQLNPNLKEKGIAISIGDDAVEWLLARTLADRSYGARPLRRAIQRHIEDALSEAFIRGQIRERAADRGGGEGRRAVVPAGRAGRDAVVVKRRVRRARCSLGRRWPGPRRRPARAQERGAGARDRADRDPEQPVPAARDAALLHLDASRATPYDERKLREDFKRLWDTGFLDDLRIEAVDGPRGKVVTLHGHRAPAHPDRRLPGQQGRSPPARSRTSSRSATPRSRSTPSTTRPKARKVEAIIKEMLAAEGPALRHRQARGEEHRRLRPAAVVRDRRGRQGEGERDRLRRQRGLHATTTLRGQDEEDQAAGLLQPELARRQDHLHRGQVARRPGGPARRPRADRGLLPRTTAT